MSDIKRSLKNVQGDLTITNGDLKITDATKGIVMTDNVGDTDKIKVYDDDGVKSTTTEKTA
jgi:hypothetical protein